MSHPVFSEFPPAQGTIVPGYVVDYIGSRTRTAHLQRELPASGAEQTPPSPPLEEEYFEWVDILESALRADSSYTMLELGAGYGRWSSRAYSAAKRRGCAAINVGLVEAEPAHLAWISEHMSDNQIPHDNYRIFDLALSAKDKAGWFYIAMPPGHAHNSAKEWYGQALTTDPHQVIYQWEFGSHSGDAAIEELEGLIAPQFRKYYQKKTMALLPGGWMAMRVKQAPLSSVLRNYEFIDLVDADIQGEELYAFPEAIEELDRRVACVHIGTHSEQCEVRLREVFHQARWKPVWDFTCLKKQATPFGPVHFNDGIQTWRNPRFTK